MRSAAAPCGIRFPHKLIATIKANRRGTAGKSNILIRVLMIGIKINAVGVLATKPEIILIMIRRINAFNIGSSNSKGMAVKII